MENIKNINPIMQKKAQIFYDSAHSIAMEDYTEQEIDDGKFREQK
jgi:hypothetical protein